MLHPQTRGLFSSFLGIPGCCCGWDVAAFCADLTVFATVPTQSDREQAIVPLLGTISQYPSLPKIPVIGMLQRRADNIGAKGLGVKRT